MDPQHYTYGWFFVTIVAARRANVFAGRGKTIVTEEIAALHSRFPGWHADTFIVMSDHVHVILRSDGTDGRALGTVVGALKSLIARRIRIELRRHAPLWQRNYYEHVIRNEDALQKIRVYILANPAEEKIDWRHVDGDALWNAR